MSLLLIEDDLPLADGLARALRGAGYAVEVAGTAAEALAAISARRPDLVILDLGLPDLDGSEIVRHLSARDDDVAVLVLSARDGLAERIRLLDLGADDYLVKPAAMAEFLARVRAALRRRRDASGSSQLVCGRLELDLEARRARVDGRAVDFNSRDWTLAVFFCERANRVVSREELLKAVFGAGEPVSENAVEQVVSRFRKRIADADLNLRTVRGIGYYLETRDGT